MQDINVTLIQTDLHWEDMLRNSDKFSLLLNRTTSKSTRGTFPRI
jgi:hypothetical protein